VCWHPSSGTRTTVITASGSGQPGLLPSALVVELELLTIPALHHLCTIISLIVFPFGKWTADYTTPKFHYSLVTVWRLRNVCKKCAEFSYKKMQIFHFANIQNVLFTGNVLTCAHHSGGRFSQNLAFCQPQSHMKLDEGSQNDVGRWEIKNLIIQNKNCLCLSKKKKRRELKLLCYEYLWVLCCHLCLSCVVTLTRIQGVCFLYLFLHFLIRRMGENHKGD